MIVITGPYCIFIFIFEVRKACFKENTHFLELLACFPTQPSSRTSFSTVLGLSY